ncbi:hypothetical protein E2C01_080857 [Portunus trituberculatus]|uniref:Uncharacterized protein n=1 Tax=Portunus trituberculatus TaxID=210409 RepID=A0A5B7IUA1_PORTR|nr:hypothetical protein [Portunus trituberculatus]
MGEIKVHRTIPAVDSSSGNASGSQDAVIPLEDTETQQCKQKLPGSSGSPLLSRRTTSYTNNGCRRSYWRMF